jgi:hypothetical protein
LSLDGGRILDDAPKKPEGESAEQFGSLKCTFGVVDAAMSKEPHRVGDGVLNLTGMQAEVDPHPCIENAYTASGVFTSTSSDRWWGERTWGGVREIRGYILLGRWEATSRGQILLFTAACEWQVENVGVTPDVVVDNRPDLRNQGDDPQLEKAVG